MDREKKDRLPNMQVGFIDAICLPVYEVGHWEQVLYILVLMFCWLLSRLNPLLYLVFYPSSLISSMFEHGCMNTLLFGVPYILSACAIEHVSHENALQKKNITKTVKGTCI